MKNVTFNTEIEVDNSDKTNRMLQQKNVTKEYIPTDKNGVEDQKSTKDVIDGMVLLKKYGDIPKELIPEIDTVIRRLKENTSVSPLSWKYLIEKRIEALVKINKTTEKVTEDVNEIIKEPEEEGTPVALPSAFSLPMINIYFPDLPVHVFLVPVSF